METTQLKITGMTCGGCVNSVRRVLLAVPGVRSADVSLDQGTARVEFDPAVARPEQLSAAVVDAGFDIAA